MAGQDEQLPYSLRVELESARHVRGLLERVPAIVYVAEPGEFGRWHYVSPQIESILGFSPEEWCADPGLWACQLHPDDREMELAREDEESAAEHTDAPDLSE